MRRHVAVVVLAVVVMAAALVWALAVDEPAEPVPGPDRFGTVPVTITD